MSKFYIELDENGDEISREPKGRGRPRKDYEEGEDGNFYKKPKLTPSSVPTSPVEESNVVVLSNKTYTINRFADVKAGTRTKVVHHKTKPVTIDQLTNTFMFFKSWYLDDGSYYIERPDLIYGDPIVDGMIFNAAYAAVLVDENSGSIAIWNLDTNQPPDMLIHNAICKG